MRRYWQSTGEGIVCSSNSCRSYDTNRPPFHVGSTGVRVPNILGLRAAGDFAPFCFWFYLLPNIFRILIMRVAPSWVGLRLSRLTNR